MEICIFAPEEVVQWVLTFEDVVLIFCAIIIVGTVRAGLSGFSVWVLVRTRAFRVRAFRADFYQLLK